MAGTVTWSLGDNLGTIRDLVQYNAATGTKTVDNHVRYDTFGLIVSHTNSQFQPWFAYTGRAWDLAASLSFHRARWYDPRAGRFLSEDPLGFAAGDVNLSRYVGNGATLWVNPSGKTLITPGLGVGGGFVVGGGVWRRDGRWLWFMEGGSDLGQGHWRHHGRSCFRSRHRRVGDGGSVGDCRDWCRRIGWRRGSGSGEHRRTGC